MLTQPGGIHDGVAGERGSCLFPHGPVREHFSVTDSEGLSRGSCCIYLLVIRSVLPALCICSVLWCSPQPSPPASLSSLMQLPWTKSSENNRTSCRLRMFAPKERACLHKILSDSFYLNKEVGGPAGLGNMKIGALSGCRLVVAPCLSSVCQQRLELSDENR